MLSRDNRLVKNALRLKMKKYRDADGKFIAEGIRFIEEALKENSVEYILYSSKLHGVNGAERIMNNPDILFEVEDSVLKEICDTENPQGAAAVVKKSSEGFDVDAADFIVICDGIQDPGNLGTIIRTSDAVGCSAVLISKGTVDVYNPKTLRSTMGSVFHVPIVNMGDFEQEIAALKNSGFAIYASSLQSQNTLYDCDFKGKTAIVIGNEAKGIPQEHMDMFTHTMIIPMAGRAESLNAASAGAVMLYEVLRQRISK